MMRRFRWTGPAAALLLAACPGGGAHTRDLPLRVTVTPTDTLAPGDSLRMTAYLRNPGRQAVRLEFEDQCQVEFYVLSPDKTVLHPPGGGASCMGGPTVLEVPPGDSVRFFGAWLATSSSLGPHTAYAVLWQHHVSAEDERVFREGHRSNIVQVQVAAGR